VTVHWLSLDEARSMMPTSKYEHLANNGSLTRRIRNACAGYFEVKLIKQFTRPALAGERDILNLSAHTRVISRQVFLSCDHQPFIYAHTLIGLTSGNRVLTDRIELLGEHSLGSILFRDPLANKLSMHLALIPGSNAFFADARPTTQQQLDKIWVRRSLYDYQGCQLIVFEAYIDFPEAV